VRLVTVSTEINATTKSHVESLYAATTKKSAINVTDNKEIHGDAAQSDIWWQGLCPEGIGWQGGCVSAG